MIRTHKGYMVTLLGMLVLVSWYAWNRDLYGKYADYQHSQENVNQLMTENHELSRERDMLQERVDGLGNDPVEIEAAIRRTRNLVREHERIYRIELPEDTARPLRSDSTLGPWMPQESRDPLRERLVTWYHETQAFLQERLQTWRNGVYHESDTRNSPS